MFSLFGNIFDNIQTKKKTKKKNSNKIPWEFQFIRLDFFFRLNKKKMLSIFFLIYSHKSQILELNIYKGKAE